MPHSPSHTGASRDHFPIKNIGIHLFVQDLLTKEFNLLYSRSSGSWNFNIRIRIGALLKFHSGPPASPTPPRHPPNVAKEGRIIHKGEGKGFIGVREVRRETGRENKKRGEKKEGIKPRKHN